MNLRPTAIFNFSAKRNFTVIPTSHQNMFLRKCLAAIIGMKKYVAWRWNRYQQNRLQSWSHSVFKIWLSKQGQLPRPLSNLWHFACGVRLWGFQKYLLWHVRFRLRKVLWSIKFITRCLPQGVQTRPAFANRERTTWTGREHDARRSVVNLWATTLLSKQLPSSELWYF